MLKKIFLFITLLSPCWLLGQHLQPLSGLEMQIPMTMPAPAGNHPVDSIFIFYDVTAAELLFSLDHPATITWKKFERNQDPVQGTVLTTQTGTISKWSSLEHDMGYRVEWEGRYINVWIIDYLYYDIRLLALHRKDIERQTSCFMMDMEIELSSPVSNNQTITFYNLNNTLSRKIDLHYQTMEYNLEKEEFEIADVKEVFADFCPPSYTAQAPLRTTQVTLSMNKDPFCEWFMIPNEIIFDYRGQAIEAYASIKGLAHYNESDENMYAKNETERIKNEDTKVSGPSPLVVDFKSNANDGAAYFEWTLSRHPDMSDPFTVFRDREFNYTFYDAGTTYTQLKIYTDQCADSTEIFEIMVTESDLKVPNAFSPGVTPGVNDEFRVAYKSLKEFKMWIFDRWGTQMYHGTDPGRGWDGKFNGRYVAPGAYVYVIEAVGSEGKKYSEKGTLSIYRTRDYTD